MEKVSVVNQIKKRLLDGSHVSNFYSVISREKEVYKIVLSPHYYHKLKKTYTLTNKRDYDSILELGCNIV